MIGLLANCHKDDDVASSAVRPADAVKLSFAASSKHTPLTRSNPVDAQKETAFNVGDGVSVSVPGQNTVTYVLGNDGYWTENPTTDYLLWKSNTQTFSAYYPVTDGTSMTNFTLPDDQTTEEKIALADYMTAKEDIARPDDNNTAISLALQRRTARVIVEIKQFNNQYTDEQKYISNLVIRSGANSYKDGAISSSIPPVLIAPYVQGKVDGKMTEGTTFTALVIPTEADPEKTFIIVFDYGNNGLFITGIPAMEAGKSYKYSLIIGKNKIEIGSVTVEDWDGTPTAIDGKAEGVVATSVSINNAPTSVAIGSKGTLSASVTPAIVDQTVTWSSRNPDVLTINATTGAYEAKATGTATITAASGTVSATCDVSVVPPTLANAFENGAVVKIEGRYMSMYLSEIFNNENGTFTQTNTCFENSVLSSNLNANGNNLVFAINNYATITFNSGDNTYSVVLADGVTVSDLSISINGYDITSQLTKTN